MRVLRGLARGDRLGLGGLRGDERRGDVRGQARRQLARHAALELGGERPGARRGRRRSVAFQSLSQLRAARARVPAGVDVVRDLERRVRASRAPRAWRRLPSRRAPRRARRAVPALFGEPLPITVLQQISVGRVGDRPARRRSRASTAVDVVAVDVADHVPAVGLEALRRVVGEPALDLAVDRDAVVVVERDRACRAPACRRASRPRARCPPSGSRRRGTRRCGGRRSRGRAG